MTAARATNGALASISSAESSLSESAHRRRCLAPCDMVGWLPSVTCEPSGCETPPRASVDGVLSSSSGAPPLRCIASGTERAFIVPQPEKYS
jgi:hypothetical protein